MPDFTSHQLRIAVLLTYDCQLLDMCGIDLFGMMIKEYMAVGMPKPIVDIALDVKIFYIGKDKPTDKGNLRRLTAEVDIQAELSTTSPEVQPGAIDILLIPGPPPDATQTQETLNFVKLHSHAGTIVLTVCTGCFVAAKAGILDGRRSSAPRALVPRMRKEYTSVHWDDERRYVKDVKIVDGVQHEIWSSGGVCNGLEMIAAFLKEKYPGPLSEVVCGMADVGDKGEFYDSAVGVETTWWLGQILRALFLGRRTPKMVRRPAVPAS